MTELSNQKADERRIIIIHKRQNKNIKVCRRSRADLNNRGRARDKRHMGNWPGGEHPRDRLYIARLIDSSVIAFLS